MKTHYIMLVIWLAFGLDSEGSLFSLAISYSIPQSEILLSRRLFRLHLATISTTGNFTRFLVIMKLEDTVMSVMGILILKL
jgi:hypothetical protein